MNASKQLPPAGGTDDLTALLRSRRVPADDTPEPLAAPEPRTPAKTTPARPQQPARPAMDRRSWYMPKTTADALAEAVEELHYATRQPKHLVLAALITVALDHLPEVEKGVALLAHVRQQGTDE